MDRLIVYPGAIPLDTDILSVERNAMTALGWLAQATLGATTGVVGLVCTPTVPASMTVNIGPGAIWAPSVIDQNDFGSLPSDSSPLMKMGLLPEAAGTNFTLNAPMISGQSINYLIEAAFGEADANPVVLPYVNPANPAQPYTGPDNSGTSQNTVRVQTVNLQLKAGAPANSGTQATPGVDPGYVGLYAITVNYGQSSLIEADIITYAGAPFNAGPFAPVAGNAGQAFAVGAGAGAQAAQMQQVESIAANYLPLSGGTLTGNIVINQPEGTAPLTIDGNQNENGANLCLTGNGTTTIHKYIRANEGCFQIINDAYSATIFQVDDSGNVDEVNSLTLNGPATNAAQAPQWGQVQTALSAATAGMATQSWADGQFAPVAGNAGQAFAVGAGAGAQAAQMQQVESIAANYLPLSGGTLTGPLISAEPGGGASPITIMGSSDANGANLCLLGNGSVAPSKTIRVQDGGFQIINSAYSATIFQVDDSGNVSSINSITTPFVALQSSDDKNSSAIYSDSGTINAGNDLVIRTGAASAYEFTVFRGDGTLQLSQPANASDQAPQWGQVQTALSTATAGMATQSWADSRFAPVAGNAGQAFAVAAGAGAQAAQMQQVESVAANYLPLSGGTLTGNIVINQPEGTTPLTIDGNQNENGASLCLTGNGTTTIHKYIRANEGCFQIINDAYTAAIFQIDDSGNVEEVNSLTLNGPATNIAQTPQWGQVQS